EGTGCRYIPTRAKRDIWNRGDVEFKSGRGFQHEIVGPCTDIKLVPFGDRDRAKVCPTRHGSISRLIGRDIGPPSCRGDRGRAERVVHLEAEPKQGTSAPRGQRSPWSEGPAANQRGQVARVPLSYNPAQKSYLP